MLFWVEPLSFKLWNIPLSPLTKTVPPLITPLPS